MLRAARVSIVRGRRYGETVSLLILLAHLSLAVSCGKETKIVSAVEGNTPPRIEGIILRPDRVHAAEEINISASTEDPDGDRLTFRWSASRGEFPLGPGLRGTLWRTARIRAVDTLRLLVYDFEDSVRAMLPVPLLLPAGPESLGTTSFINQIDVTWNSSVDEDISYWSGYDVFMDTVSLAGRPFADVERFQVNSAPVRGNRFRVLRLETGQKYFFEVRARRDYDQIVEISDFVEETDAAPRPQGTVSSFRELQSVAPMALDLSAGRVRRIDVSDPSNIANLDLYLGTVRSDDRGNTTLVFKSVSELADRNPAWAERVVQIKRLGLDWNVSETDDTGWGTTAVLENDQVYAIRTPEGNYGKIQVTGSDGFFPNRKVWIQWAYQTLPDYPNF